MKEINRNIKIDLIWFEKNNHNSVPSKSKVSHFQNWGWEIIESGPEVDSRVNGNRLDPRRNDRTWFRYFQYCKDMPKTKSRKYLHVSSAGSASADNIQPRNCFHKDSIRTNHKGQWQISYNIMDNQFRFRRMSMCVNFPSFLLKEKCSIPDARNTPIAAALTPPGIWVWVVPTDTETKYQ